VRHIISNRIQHIIFSDKIEFFRNLKKIFNLEKEQVEL